VGAAVGDAHRLEMHLQLRPRALGGGVLDAYPSYDELPVGRLLSTFVKIASTVVPRPVIAPRATIMIRASMTAYSVAVGPSSDLRNVFAQFTKPFIEKLL